MRARRSPVLVPTSQGPRGRGRAGRQLWGSRAGGEKARVGADAHASSYPLAHSSSSLVVVVWQLGWHGVECAPQGALAR